jgi:hypothetical protein
MITLISLLDICENKRVFNEEYGGYYLGHDNNKVFFGYIYPLISSFLHTKTDNTLFHLYSAFGTGFSYNGVISFLNENEYKSSLFKIPSLEEINIMATSLAKYDTRLDCWITNNNDLEMYNFGTKTFIPESILIPKAAILLTRSIKLQQ